MINRRMQVLAAVAVVALFAGLAVTQDKKKGKPGPVTSAGHPAEGEIKPFLGAAKLEMHQVFKGGRFPNVAVAVDGTVLAVWGGVKVCRSEDGGKTWGPEILIGKGFMGGGVTVDEKTGDVLAFVEKNHPPAPLTMYRSKDHGKTWTAEKPVINKDKNGNVPSMHMNDVGITLRHGKNAGRIIRAARHYAGGNHRGEWPNHYTTAIYSDDSGKTWETSEPFAEMGTGEAALCELSNGQLYYNSRAHWHQKTRPLRRRSARSRDGGKTWKEWRIERILPDGPQDTNYGCMGGLVRLPIAGKDILIYSNCDTPRGRNHMTVWASFDGGRSWPLKHLVYEGRGAYSSLNAGRPKTKSEGWIYLNFEGGPKGGSTVARFNLAWLLGGKNTGNGKVPEDIDPSKTAPAK